MVTVRLIAAAVAPTTPIRLLVLPISVFSLVVCHSAFMWTELNCLFPLPPSLPPSLCLSHSLHSSHWSQGKEKRFEDRPICSDIKRCLALWKVVEAMRLTDISTECLLGLLTSCPIIFPLCPAWVLLSNLHSENTSTPLGFGVQHLVRQGWLMVPELTVSTSFALAFQVCLKTQIKGLT